MQGKQESFGGCFRLSGCHPHAEAWLGRSAALGCQGPEGPDTASCPLIKNAGVNDVTGPAKVELEDNPGKTLAFNDPTFCQFGESFPRIRILPHIESFGVYALNPRP